MIRSLKLTWNQPFYQRYDKKRRAPKEQLLDFMINHFRLEMALKLSMMKDLGTRPIELLWLKVQDIDLATGTVSITGAKHTVGREQKLREKWLSILEKIISEYQTDDRKKFFPQDAIHEVCKESHEAREFLHAISLELLWEILDSESFKELEKRHKFAK